MSLTKAIDALLAFVEKSETSSSIEEPRPIDESRFYKLDNDVYLEAFRAGLLAHLPSEADECIGKSKLPVAGTMHGFWPNVTDRWRNDMITMRALAEDQAAANAAKSRPKIGRPRKGQAKSDEHIESALVQHHGYDMGSVTNHTPASVAELAKTSSKSKSTVSRFLTKKFGSDGHDKYVAICNRDEIAFHIAKWRDELANFDEIDVDRLITESRRER